MSWLILAVAIVLEVAGATNMKLSEGFSRFAHSILVFVFYGSSIVALTLALKRIDVSVAYAVWSGAGTADRGVGHAHIQGAGDGREDLRARLDRGWCGDAQPLRRVGMIGGSWPSVCGSAHSYSGLRK